MPISANHRALQNAVETSMAHLIETLIGNWQAMGLELRPGASEEALTRFESETHLALPADFRFFLSLANGMEEAEVDPDTQIRFWSVEEIRSAAEELTSSDPAGLADYFVFADYSIWAHGYAIRLGAGQATPIAIVGDEGPVRIAASFSHFVEKYLEDWRQVFHQG